MGYLTASGASTTTPSPTASDGCCQAKAPSRNAVIAATEVVVPVSGSSSAWARTQYQARITNDTPMNPTATMTLPRWAAIAPANAMSGKVRAPGNSNGVDVVLE